ncbi:hypothetical protein JOC76_005906 [Neobacillus cucumis]|nr:hypothetical protein [Neobacillus cucumis]
MDVIIERACGMDVHKDNITACIMTPDGKEIQTFSTKTVFLLKLIDWVKEHGCTMSQWKAPVFIGNLLLTYWNLKELSI